jgi:hypothetical protein
MDIEAYVGCLLQAILGSMLLLLTLGITEKETEPLDKRILHLLAIGENGDDDRGRLRSHTHILEFIGESYRFRQRMHLEEQQSGETKTETG